MVLKAIENLIEELKGIESLEHARRKQDYLTTQELVKSYQESNRASFMLNLIYKNLLAVIEENSKEGEIDTRSDEQKQTHQQCFGLLTQIGHPRV